MPATKTTASKALRDSFVAEFGEHAAAHSETGRLLGFDQAKQDDAADSEPEPGD